MSAIVTKDQIADAAIAFIHASINLDSLVVALDSGEITIHEYNELSDEAESDYETTRLALTDLVGGHDDQLKQVVAS